LTTSIAALASAQQNAENPPVYKRDIPKKSAVNMGGLNLEVFKVRDIPYYRPLRKRTSQEEDTEC